MCHKEAAGLDGAPVSDWIFIGVGGSYSRLHLETRSAGCVDGPHECGIGFDQIALQPT